MTRRILLTLADDTTDTECGACRFLDANAEGLCIAYRARVSTREKRTRRGLYIYGLRLPECIAAEAAAARMVEIAPEDAAAVVDTLAGLVHADGSEWAAGKPIVEALRAHAARDAVALEAPEKKEVL